MNNPRILLTYPRFIAFAAPHWASLFEKKIIFKVEEVQVRLHSQVGSDKINVDILESSVPATIPVGPNMIDMALDGRMSIKDETSSADSYILLTNIKPAQLEAFKYQGQHMGTAYDVKTINTIQEKFNDKSIVFCVFSIVTINDLLHHYKIYILNSEFMNISEGIITDLLYRRDTAESEWKGQLAGGGVTFPAPLGSTESHELFTAKSGGGKYRKKRKKRKTKRRSRISGAKKKRRYKTRRTRKKRH
jgi:hypothetical protein